MELKMEAERVKHAQALAHEVAKVLRVTPKYSTFRVLYFFPLYMVVKEHDEYSLL